MSRSRCEDCQSPERKRGVKPDWGWPLAYAQGSDCLFMFALFFICSFVHAQSMPTRPDVTDKSPLAAKQEIVRDRVSQLEDRMFRLAENLAKTDPDQAERLRSALSKSREMLVRKNMDELIAILNKGDLTDASDRQKTMLVRLDEIMRILLDDAADPERQKEEMRRLREMKEKVASLLAEQKALRQSTEQSEKANTTQSATSKAETLADAQRKAAEAAGRLAEQMGKSADAKDDSKEEPMPGRENVEQAGKHMKSAGGKLDEKNYGAAGGEQDQAIRELSEAVKQMEESLNQLRREQQEEVLRRLEDRFREMLARQLRINQDTDGLAKKPAAQWTRPEQLLAGELGQGETSLAGDADKTLSILKQEGSTVAFPRVVEQLASDFHEAGRRLSAQDAGPVTLRVQSDIIESLQQLLEAVRQMQAKLAEQANAQSEGSDSQKPPPLLPNSAELKLLRAYQSRLNRDTTRFNKDRGEDKMPLPDDMQSRMQQLSDRQNSVAEMTRQLYERGKKP